MTFQYPGAEEPALTGVSFTALPGEVTAIIGGTGSGKSTLAGLIPRFYDVNHGRVLVDGVDVREMTQADLRARIGFVPQKAVLFTGTVAANIRYGREDASDEEVRHAATVAQAIEFVDAHAGAVRGRRSRRAASISRADRSSGSRLRARSCASRTSTCSTTASRRSTSRPTRSCARRSRAKPPTPPSSSSPSASAPSSTPTASSCSTTGGWSASARTRELLEKSEIYREIVASQVSLEEVA